MVASFCVKRSMAAKSLRLRSSACGWSLSKAGGTRLSDSRAPARSPPWPPPAVGVLGDPSPDGVSGLRVGVPDPAAGEHVARRQVQVEAGRVGLLGPLVAEVDARLRLVRRLVLGEARVAVDAEQRAALAPRVGHQVRADVGQSEPEVLDEGERGLEQVVLVAALVRVEPLAVVVGLQLAQEGEQLGPELAVGHHPTLYHVAAPAPWRSGYAAACKAVYTGSIPVGASIQRPGLGWLVRG